MNIAVPKFPKPKDAPKGEPKAPRVTAKDKKIARDKVWRRCAGFCEMCSAPVLYERGEWNSMHTAHREGGIHRPNWDISNLLGVCINCHGITLHNPKSVPKKG